MGSPRRVAAVSLAVLALAASPIRAQELPAVPLDTYPEVSRAPIGRALDYALIRPIYMLGGLAPEWFGLQTDDAQRFREAHPELVIPRDAPRLHYQQP